MAQVAEGCQVELPTGNGKVEKAAARIQRSFRQRQAHQTAKVKSSELALIEGVILLDACDATPQELARLSAVASDALCVVIPGHECPAPDTCSGRLSVPVMHRLTARQHLVAACHHNLGCIDIVPYSCHDAEVSAAAMVCCSFVMYRDEAPSPEAWTRLSQRPVRAVAEAFSGSGLDQPFTSPWGRSFRAAGKPTAPEVADTFMVQAKVSQTILSQALTLSGFNGVYVVPRTWEHQPPPGWDIIWMKGPRSEVERHARVLPEQHGIVRGRKSSGIRVPSESFARAFASAQPNDKVPAQVATTVLCKVGPFPAEASVDSVQAWADQLKWTCRVMKMVGPSFHLIGGPSMPDFTTAAYNGRPVLLHRIQPRRFPRPVVSGGRSSAFGSCT